MFAFILSKLKVGTFLTTKIKDYVLLMVNILSTGIVSVKPAPDFNILCSDAITSGGASDK